MPDDAESDSFLLAIVTVLFLVLLFPRLRALFRRKPLPEPEAWRKIGFAASSPVVRKATAIQQSTPRWRRFLVDQSFFVIVLAVEASFLYRAFEVTADPEHFDPHSVLGIETHATRVEAKAAYRRLSLEYHPDKNPDPNAAATFATISKAHQILTDPVAARNYAKYGNPDGYQGFVGGFGLPAWMMDENAALPLLGVVIGLPLVILYLFFRDKKAKQAQAITKIASQVYFHAVFNPEAQSRASAPPPLLRLVAASFAEIPFDMGLNTAQRLDLLTLQPSAAKGGGSKGGGSKGGGGKKTKPKGKKAKAGKDKPKTSLKELKARAAAGMAAEGDDDVAVEEEEEEEVDAGGGEEDGGAVAAGTSEEQAAAAAAIGIIDAREWLLKAHLRRVAIPKSLVVELHTLLLHAPAVCEAFFALALRNKKVGFAVGARPILRLAQFLCQAVPSDEAVAYNCYLQMPHITPAILASAAPNLSTSDGGVRGLLEVADMPSRERAPILAKAFGASVDTAQLRDAEAFCAHVFPRAVLSTRYLVKGEDDASVAVGDVLTIQATLTVAHRAPPGSPVQHNARFLLPWDGCHAPLYPHPKSEGWVAVLTHKGAGRVLNVKAAPGWSEWKPCLKGGGQWTAELMMQVETAGKLKLEVHAVCSAYVGADVVAEVALDVANFRAADRDDDDDDDSDDAPDGHAMDGADFVIDPDNENSEDSDEDGYEGID